MKNLFIYGVSIFVQTMFVFGFLVIFYFLYVINVEKKDFGEQMDIIVDDLSKNIGDNLPNIISKDTSKYPDYDIIISGIIDTIEEKITKDSTDQINQVIQNNNKIRNSLLKLILLIFSVILIIFIVFRKTLPYYSITKEAVIVVIFIGITEFIFLSFISSKYISADPNKVKYALATAVHEWILKNKKY